MAKDKRPPQRRREPDTQEINRTSEDVEQNLQRDGLGPDALQMMQRAQQPMQPTQGAQEPIPAAQVLAEKPAARRMTQERVRKAMDTLLKYKAGKARLESRLVEVEQWWKMRHWEWMQEQGAKGDMQTASAWLFNVIISKHADGIQSIPEANVLPREESDRETARSLSAIIPCVLEQNEFDATYSDVLWQKLKGGTGAYGVFWDKAGSFLDWTNATPYYAFKRFGEGGKAVFEGLMDGWDRLAFNSRQLIDYANGCYTTEQVRAWSQELHEIKLDGVRVQMTTAQIMSLYCLNKRAQARGHLLGGGIRIADIKTKGKTITQADNHILGAQDIANITKLLTAEQRSVADKMQEFMNTVCTDWGNEVSMRAGESGKKLIAPSKKMVRAFAVNAVVLAFSSVMEAAFTAWRDDDEYETYAEKFDDSFLDTLLENMNPANNLPFVKDVASAIQGRSTERMDSAWAYNLAQGVQEVYKYLTGQSKNPAYNGIYKTLNGLSQMSGFAVGGLTREVVSLYNNLIAAPMGYTRIQTYNDSASDAADAILRAYAAGDNGLVTRYIDIAAKHGIEGDRLENAIKSAAGEALVAGELDADEVRAVLKEYAGKSDGDVDKLLLKWGYKVQTGLEYSDMKDDYIAGNIDRATALEYYGEDKVSQWDYEKETGSSYSDMREEYVSGRMTASQAREYLMAYGGKTEAKADEQIDRWDYYAATGESDNYTKYWRMYYAFENGGDFRKYAQEWIDAGVKKSNIAASIAGRYKEEYLAIKGTAAGDAMLERLLDLYEAIGYNRAYERKYINDKWKLD